MATAIIKLGVDTAETKSGLKDFTNSMDKLQKKLNKTADNLQATGKKLSLAITVPLLAVGSSALYMASQLEATNAKFDTVFGSMNNNVNSFIKEWQTLVPATLSGARSMASGIQDLLIPMGFAREKATGMTKQMLTLAGALTNFNNATHSAEDVTNALNSGLTGEYQSLKRLGVQVNKELIQQKAVAIGLAKTTKEVTKQDEAQAFLALAYEQSGDALKAFTKENLDSKTKLNISLNKLKDMGAELSTRFLPLINKTADAIKKLSEALGRMDKVTQNILIAIGLVGASLGPLLIAMGFIAKAIAGLIVVIPILKAKIIALKASLLPLIGKIMAFASVLLVLVGVLKQIAKKLEVFDSLKPILKDIASLGGDITKVFSFIISFLIKFGQAFFETFYRVGEMISEIVKFLTVLGIVTFNNLMTLLSKSMGLIKTFATDVKDLFSKLGESIWNALTGKGINFEGIFDGFGEGLKKEFNKIDFEPIQGTNFKGIYEDYTNELANIIAGDQPEFKQQAKTKKKTQVKNGKVETIEEPAKGEEKTSIIKQQELASLTLKGSQEAQQTIQRTSKEESKDVEIAKNTKEMTQSLKTISKQLQAGNTTTKKLEVF